MSTKAGQNMKYFRTLAFSITTAIKMLATSVIFASTPNSILDTEIKNLANTILEANVSDDALKARIESTRQLMVLVETLTQRESIRDDQRRFLGLLKYEILDLQALLINAISCTDPEALDYERIRIRIDLYHVIIKEDIRHEAFKHNLKTLIDHMQEQLTRPNLQTPTQESLEWKRLILDLIAYRNSEDRTEAERVEYDLYMSVMGPHDRSIMYRSQELN